DELVGSGVSLAVASVPEGLPLLATAAQLAAAQRLAARGALVRNGRSVEALGRVDIICLDKTGTLTQGKIRLHAVSDGDELEVVEQVSRNRRRVLAAALRASPGRGAFAEHDPTDEALFLGGERVALSDQYGVRRYQRVAELSDGSARSYHATLGQCEGFVEALGRSDDAAPPSARPRQLLSIKGAPEMVLPLCAKWRREDSEVE